jgi:sorting nexin-9/18/33
MWEPNPEAHTVTVREPSKQKKFKGIKTFTAYQIVPSSTGRAVSRRYKHYDWFHSRLEEKFTLNSVPPLPDKQYYGNKLFAEAIHIIAGNFQGRTTFANL